MEPVVSYVLPSLFFYFYGKLINGTKRLTSSYLNRFLIFNMRKNAFYILYSMLPHIYSLYLFYYPIVIFVPSPAANCSPSKFQDDRLLWLFIIWTSIDALCTRFEILWENVDRQKTTSGVLLLKNAWQH